ncbi:hypothetical protein TNCV_2801791 [Trichonephila clavipes]|nr:hypothetical protein TNCV_2801791 [Trichonephila clavipes]
MEYKTSSDGRFWPFLFHQIQSRTFLDVSPGFATVSVALPRFDLDRLHRILPYVTHFSSTVIIRLING